IIGGVVLIFFGKITYVEFSPILVAVLGLFGINVAWKAPSSAQAQQLQSQQQQIASVQALATQAASAVQSRQEQAHTHPQAPVQQQPVTPQPQFVQPMPPPVVDYGRHWGDTDEVSAIDTQRIAVP